MEDDMTTKHLSFKASFRALLMRLSLCLMMIGIGLVPHGVLATSISVLATVDGVPISNIDFENRRNFLIKTTGLDYNDGNREQIDSDVLQMLVDDIIKIRAGLSIGSQLEETARQRATELVNSSFAINGENPDTVLSSMGISREVAEQKFFADVLWASTIQSRFSKQFSEARQEAEEELERIRKNVQKPHVNLDEIVLTPEPNRSYAATRDLAEQISEALRNGADFGRIAQQYSTSGSGRQGGQLGWVQLERLHPDARAIIEDLPAGVLTIPLDIDGTVVIYRINGIRINGQNDPNQDVINLYRLVYPTDMTNESAVADGRSLVANDIKTVRSCNDLGKLHDRYNSGLDPDLGQFRIIEIAPRLREIIAKLGTNDKSDILNFTEGLAVFMVCNRVNPVINLPNLDEIELAIQNRHFSALSARYLNRLRKQAIVSYKDKI
jgi:peptidyl-prolyl cis-trans isomerase SurA